MPVPRDGNKMPSEPGVATSQLEVAIEGGDVTFGDVDLGLDQLLDLDSVEKLRWDTPDDALLQSVAHIDPRILAATWASGPLVEMPQTMPWADIMTQSFQDTALPRSHPTRPEASLERMLPELYVI